LNKFDGVDNDQKDEDVSETKETGDMINTENKSVRKILKSLSMVRGEE